MTKSNIVYKNLRMKDESNVSILCCEEGHHKIVA